MSSNKDQQREEGEGSKHEGAATAESACTDVDSDKESTEGGAKAKSSVAIASKEAPVKKRRATKARRKKPRDMPRRPLSAYNFFFRIERERWLEEQAKVSTEKKSGGTLFSEMGKAIAARWRQLPEREARKYQQMASDDMERYKREMDEYHTGAAHVARLQKVDKKRPPAQNKSEGDQTEAITTTCESGAVGSDSLGQSDLTSAQTRGLGDSNSSNEGRLGQQQGLMASGLGSFLSDTSLGQVPSAVMPLLERQSSAGGDLRSFMPQFPREGGQISSDALLQMREQQYREHLLAQRQIIGRNPPSLYNQIGSLGGGTMFDDLYTAGQGLQEGSGSQGMMRAPPALSYYSGISSLDPLLAQYQNAAGGLQGQFPLPGSVASSQSLHPQLLSLYGGNDPRFQREVNAASMSQQLSAAFASTRQFQLPSLGSQQPLASTASHAIAGLSEQLDSTEQTDQSQNPPFYHFYRDE